MRMQQRQKWNKEKTNVINRKPDRRKTGNLTKKQRAKIQKTKF